MKREGITDTVGIGDFLSFLPMIVRVIIHVYHNRAASSGEDEDERMRVS